MKILLAIVLLASSRYATASPEASLELSDQGGLHMLRPGGGVTNGRWFVRGLLDPVGLFDGRHTFDLVTGVALDRFELDLGWRDTALRLADGVRMYDAILLGASGRVAGGARSFGLHAGATLATTIVAHGENRPVRWILRDYGTTLDPYSLRLYVEARYAF